MAPAYTGQMKANFSVILSFWKIFDYRALNHGGILGLSLLKNRRQHAIDVTLKVINLSHVTLSRGLRNITVYTQYVSIQ